MFTLYGPIVVICAVLSAILLLRWYFGRRPLPDEAVAEFAERSVERAKSVAGVDEATFVKLFVAGHEPRWALYMALAFGLIVLLTPGFAVVWATIWVSVIQQLDTGPWYEIGYYPWMFFMFFGFCGFWALCGAVVARLFHARSPEPYLAALARARGEPLEDRVIKPSRPKWARKARPSWAPKLPQEKKDGDAEL